MGRKRYEINSVKWRGVLFDKWLLKIEKKCFGWQYYGEETEDDEYIEIGERKVSKEHKYIDWLEFRRVSPFSHNFLFNLTEMFSKIFSFLRRVVLSLGGPLAIIVLILSLVGMSCNSTEMTDTGFEILKYLAIIYFAGLVGGTLFFALLGKLWRVVFRIDEKLRQNLRDNGYDDDLTNCDFN